MADNIPQDDAQDRDDEKESPTTLSDAGEEGGGNKAQGDEKDPEPGGRPGSGCFGRSMISRAQPWLS